ncbi:patatin-like phospholipase family protein [Sphingomonas carotinifaciens]|nr:patatin-like phospholipase family protein [Sphingomonas carotinifaciens]MBB4084658.1 NTE family protein [Sphingomonas carotinifaciens]SDF18891.1 NTE family protein [Sphingomonas carotinifaciens]
MGSWTDDHGARPRVALVLGGGNALGAYQAGVFEALQSAGIVPEWIAGTSIGAVNGALICGNAPEARLDRLRDFWRPAEGAISPTGPGETARRTASVAEAMLWGRGDVFAPRGPGTWPMGTQALYDSSPLGRGIARLVDIDRLNDGGMRYATVAVDLETGAERVFDTQRGRVGVDHVRASGALLPLFPPVTVDGRDLVDGGTASNLPVDLVLAEPGEGALLCIAVDLLPLEGGAARTLGDSLQRMQDLAFACQARRAITGWQRDYDLRARIPGETPRTVTLIHMAYGGEEREVSGKALDFSARSIGERWTRGARDMHHVIAQLDAGEIATGRSGLTVYRFQDGERREG